MPSSRQVLAAPLALLLGSCVFIDDFDRFRGKAARDGGSDDGSVEGDADVTPGEGGAPRDSGARDGSRDAQSGPSDGGSDSGDGGSAPPDDADVGPADTGMPAPGCANASVIPTQFCYPDRDNDRFADLRTDPVLACSCPSGYLAVPDTNAAQNDCWDDPNTHGADVYPGQATYFPTGYGIGSNNFDYDCDGAESKKGAVIAANCAGLLGLLCSSTEGYVRETACGRPGDYQVCGPVGLNCGVASQDSIVQTCR